MVRLTRAGNGADLYLGAQVEIFRQLEESEPGVWTFGQSARTLRLAPADVERRHIVELELNGLLPTPPDDVPIAQILELKQRRRDEFYALRLAVDELHGDVMASGDLPRAQSVAVRRLSQAISDIRGVVQKTWLDRLATEFKFEFEATRTFNAAVAGAAVAHFVVPGFEGIGAALGAAVAQFKYEAKQADAIKGIPPRSQEFAYLYHIGKTFPGTL